MIVLNIYKKICRSRLLKCSDSLPKLSSLANKSFSNGYDRSKRSIKTDRIHVYPCKHYSDETEQNSNILLPPLSKADPICLPSLFDTIKNSFNVMILKQQMDPEFDRKEFMAASHEVLYMVSRALAFENYTEVEEYIYPEALEEVKQSIEKLNPQQKRCIQVREGDCNFSFPSRIQLFNEIVDGKRRKGARILVVYNYVLGLSIKQNNLNLFASISKDDMLMANYGFERDYTDGTNSSWNLYLVNHFSPTYVVKEFQI